MGCCNSSQEGQTNQSDQITAGTGKDNTTKNIEEYDDKKAQTNQNELNQQQSKNEQKYVIDEQDRNLETSVHKQLDKVSEQNSIIGKVNSQQGQEDKNKQSSVISNQQESQTANSENKKILQISLLYQEYKVNKILKDHQIFTTIQLESKDQKNQYQIMKKISKKSDNKQIQNQINQTIEIYSNIDFRNIVTVLQSYEDENHRYFVQEFYSGGNLLEQLKKYEIYNEQMSSRILRQILGSMIYCHIYQICHRNLRLEKFIFQSDKIRNLKLIDFTHSSRIQENQKLTEQVGSQYYVAPEILLKKPYTQKCDMWSIGVILYILLSGQHPFEGTSVNEILNKTVQGNIEFNSDIWNSVSDNGKDIIRKLLNKDPEERITASEAYAHPWVQQNFNVEPLETKIIKKLQSFQSNESLLTQKQFDSFTQYLKQNGANK